MGSNKRITALVMLALTSGMTTAPPHPHRLRRSTTPIAITLL